MQITKIKYVLGTTKKKKEKNTLTKRTNYKQSRIQIKNLISTKRTICPQTTRQNKTFAYKCDLNVLEIKFTCVQSI